MFDLIIAGGRVVDGTGSAEYRADVGIKGEVIDAIGDLSMAQTARIIDAKGMVVSANRSFLALSNDEKKLPEFVEQLPLDQVLDHIRSARGYARY